MITSLNWTWEYIDEYMTLPRLFMLSAYWSKHPPVHICAGAIAGVNMNGDETEEMPATEASVPDFALLPEYE